MTALLPPFPKFRAFDSTGVPLAGGLLYTYAAGTTTPLATYTDETGVTPNSNPVVLDSTGQANVWLTQGVAYKFALQSSLGVSQPGWPVDQITGGIQGTAGTPGTVWYTGTGVPSSSIGVNGDYYLDSTAAGNAGAGDVYTKSGGVWTKLTNILGPAGSNLDRIVNGRFWQALTPWISNGTVPPVLGTGSTANSGSAQQFADQSVTLAVTSDGSISQAFSIQALDGTVAQNLTFNTTCYLADTPAKNANTGYVKVYLFDGQNSTETLVGTYNLTATSSTPSWVAQTIDLKTYLPVAGDYGLRFEIQAFTDNIGGAAGTKGTYTAVDDISLITSSAGVAGLTGPTGPQGPPGTSSGVLQRVSFASVGANVWTSPLSVNYIDVTCVGAGGGGGGGHTASPGGGGGGGGAGNLIRRRITITPNTAYTITIGSKGLGSGAGTNGTAGGDTTFSTLIVAKGGVGGGTGLVTTSGPGGASGGPDTAYANGTIPVAVAGGTGGGPGTAGASYILANTTGNMQTGAGGGSGGDGLSVNPGIGGACETYVGGTVSATNGAGGGGAASPFGNGAAGGSGASAGSNATAGAYGTGGGGGGHTFAGGNGMDGYCVIEYVG